MKTESRRLCRYGVLGLGLMMGGIAGAGAAPRASSYASDWPPSARMYAQAMIAKYGKPHRSDAQSLTWLGLFRGKRTVLHRAGTDEFVVEQAVVYRVPPKKVEDLLSFDPRLTVDRKDAELSVRTESVASSLLALNLAHEVASGFKSPGEAREFRDRQLRLAEAGKSSRYRSALIFEKAPRSLPRVFVPGGVNVPPPRDRMTP